MRGLLSSLAFGLICASATSALATGGAFRTIASQTAASCARECADDGLCIAWTLTADSCALSAIAPTEWPQAATEVGLSTRAPSFAAMPQRPQILTPAPPETATQSEDSATHGDTDSATHGDTDYALLGGPAEGDLRPRLGNRR